MSDQQECKQRHKQSNAILYLFKILLQLKICYFFHLKPSTGIYHNHQEELTKTQDKIQWF